jgi:catechol 2,3-dioxygenase-like lactoylglutathione lyase family enzyme
MKLNHINLVVSNVADAIKFFVTHFGFVCTETKGDNIVAVLQGTDGFILVLMAAREEQITYPRNFHVGFMLKNAAEVNETYLRLKDAGFSIGDEPRKIRDSFGFYFPFDNLMIEVGHYL